LSITCLFFFSNSLSQSNGIANEKLDYFEKKTKVIYSQIVEFNKRILLKKSESKAIRLKEEMLHHLALERANLKADDLRNEKELSKSFVAFLNATENYLQAQPEKLVEYTEKHFSDSIVHQQFCQISNLEIISAQAKSLQDKIEIYCIEYKVLKREKKTPINKYFESLKNSVRYANQIQNVIMEIRIKERDFFSAFEKDSLEQADKYRISLIHFSDQANLFLRTFPNFPGERTLKSTAIRSLEEYKMEGHRKLLRLLDLRKKEQSLTNNDLASHDKNSAYKMSFHNPKRPFHKPSEKEKFLCHSILAEREIHEDRFDHAYKEFLQEKMVPW